MALLKMKYFILMIFFFSASNVFSQWQLMETAPAGSFKKIVFTPAAIYAITETDGITQSVDSGISWQQTNNGLSGEALNCYDLLVSGDTLFLATVDGVYLSINGGYLWIKKSEGMVIGGNANNIYAYSIFQNDNKLYAGTFLGVYASTDFGETWNITQLTGNNSKVVTFNYYNNSLFAGKDNNTGCPAYKTTNSGLNWIEVPVSGLSPIGVLSFYGEEHNLFAATGTGIWLSTNSGLNWQMRNTGLPPNPFNSCIIKYMGCLFTSLKSNGGSVYRSVNNGASWIDMSEGFPYLMNICNIGVFNNKIFAATSGGIYVRDIEDLITGKINTSGNSPSAFKLWQNYPNPFNPSTKIKFEIPAEGRGQTANVKLVIYNTLGKQIDILVNGNLSAGSYEVVWPAPSGNASSLSSGIYYYRLEADGFTETKKMILIK
jgi:hypothetical protein